MGGGRAPCLALPHSCWQIRPLWRHYIDSVNALLFVVDSRDEAHLAEAAAELGALLAEPQLRDAVLLVYANKQDVPGAASVAEVLARLDLSALRGRAWLVQPCSATQGWGLFEGMDWLSDKLLAA